jgi:hypothetical protein
VLVAIVALAACGGSAAQRSGTKQPSGRAPAPVKQKPWGADVARVGRHLLTKQMLDHWVAIEAVVSYEYKPTRPVPKGLDPDPPSYRACIAYLRSSAKPAPGAAPPSDAALRAECASKEKGLQRHTMELLLTDYWVEEETNARGIDVSNDDIRRAIRKEFASEQDRYRFMRLTHQSVADERFLLESKIRLRKLQVSISPLRPDGHESAEMAAAVDRAYARLGNQIKRKWIPRTECSPGFVVVECKAYGPVQAELEAE